MSTFVPSQYSHAKSNPSTSWDLASGNYLGPGGWVYNYNDRTKKVKIVVAPAGHSGAGTTYSRGDSVYTAIVKELLTKGKVLSNAEVKALRGAAGSPASSALSRVKEAFAPSAPSSAPPSAAAPGEDEPFYKQPWFPPVAIFGGLIVIGIIVIAVTDEEPPKKRGQVIAFPRRAA